MNQRVYNFSAGPAVLPLPVLERVQKDLLSLPGVGASILEISHRSAAFERIVESARSRLRGLLEVPDGYQILFLQGGARLQFSMVPMNLLRGSREPAEYILTGSWGKKALEEAGREGPTRVLWDGKEQGYRRVPADGELQASGRAAYVHMTSNETIEGVQFHTVPDVGSAVLACDSSSDFLSRPVPVERFGLIYACAQKNAGPAGLTVVVMREDLLERSQDTLPGYLNYRVHAANGSMWNTPPTFAIYVLDLVAQWLDEEIGGLEAMHLRNREKAFLLYEELDQSQGFYAGHAEAASRSLMNVTFRLPSPDLEARFLQEAAERGLTSLKGHRSVGGIRASVYNAMPREGVVRLRDFMSEFRRKRA